MSKSVENQANGEWFREWFDELYLQVYAHRNREEADRLVEWMGVTFASEAERGVADLACGYGRHARAMAERGWEVTGLDLSMPLLRRALSEQSERTARMVRPRYVQGDLRRLPLRTSAFGLAVNLFTSFGYFSSDSDHAATLFEMARILDPDGILLLDLANPVHVRANLVPEDRTVLNNMEVLQQRSLEENGRRVVKNMEIGLPGGTIRKVRESVRLFESEEIEAMIGQAGLQVEGVIGGYHGQPFDPRESSRMIVWARKHN
ncbi:methyltransferase domain-containing protein [bacterium]|nr:methyltransferase domain-containing protein [bacterium]